MISQILYYMTLGASESENENENESEQVQAPKVNIWSLLKHCLHYPIPSPRASPEGNKTEEETFSRSLAIRNIVSVNPEASVQPNRPS